MLSYQHAYHAGNLADVHKHALVAWMLDYLTQKPKPLHYLETHAGRAIYDLSGPEAIKTGEAQKGIGTVRHWFEGHPYGRVLDATNGYPGSPAIARAILRPEDMITLAELHPQEAEALKGAMGDYAHVVQDDGFAMALSRTPPTPRRGMLLCDPSYEIKSDYQTIPSFLAKLHRRWGVGVLALWYPVLTNGAHVPMLGALKSAFPDALRHEVQFAPAKEGHGMVGSGMFVINPPWGLAEQADWLQSRFATL